MRRVCLTLALLGGIASLLSAANGNILYAALWWLSCGIWLLNAEFYGK